MAQKVYIRMKRGLIASNPMQRKNMLGLGLNRREKTVTREDSAELRGMLRKVIHMVDISTKPFETAETRNSTVKVLKG